MGISQEHGQGWRGCRGGEDRTPSWRAARPLPPYLQQRTGTQRQVGARGFAFALLIPAFVLIVGVALWPAAQTMWMSLHKVSMIMPGAEVLGLQNYQKQLSDPRFWNAWRNTAYFTVASVLAASIVFLYALRNHLEVE